MMLNIRLVTLIGEAVFARCLSAIKAERTRACKILSGPQKEPFRGDKQQFIDDLEQALYASKIISYAQGFMLMREAAKEVRKDPSQMSNTIELKFNNKAEMESQLRRYRSYVARRVHHQSRWILSLAS